MFTVRTVSDVLPDVPSLRRSLDDADLAYVDVMHEGGGVSVVVDADPRTDPMIESDVRRVVLQAIARRRAVVDPTSGPLLQRIAQLEEQIADLAAQLDERAQA